MSQKPDGRANVPQKTREEIKAEREAKKLAKAAAKAGKAKAKVAVAISPAATANCKIPETIAKDVNVNENHCAAETNKDASVECATTSGASTEKSESLPSEKKSHVEESRVGPEEPAKEVEDHRLNGPAEVGTSEGKSDEKQGKSKAELRALRRAKQEAQRAAKLQKDNVKEPAVNPVVVKPCAETVVSKCSVKKNVAKSETKENAHKLNLFKHLYDERELSSFNVAINSSIHPAIIRLGAQYANKIVVGSNARCVALLAAMKQVIRDFVKPAQADLVRGLEAHLQESLAYLHHCRPLAVSMKNAVRHLKWQMTRFSSLWSDEQSKSKLQDIIDTYISEQIQLAGEAISQRIESKILNGNVILIYGFSSLIYKILVDAHDAGKQFCVIVVDSRPRLEGKEQLRRLVKYGLDCSYVLINAVSFVMPKVSKVFLGAHAILANGAVMSRIGTAQIALIAKAFNVPVLVACETHKSSERVLTDSIVCNELDNADDLANVRPHNNKKSLLTKWRAKKTLNLLNITYDVTPADFVTAVVTELAILPCTSVPVILRIKPSEI